jgi:WD40 repeat protein
MSVSDIAEVNPESPWLGLKSFSEATQRYFFGREEELRELFERVEHKPLTVLFGQSGLGKTSLLQAGLVPRLRSSGYLPISIRLRYTDQDPLLQIQVLTALQAQMRAVGLSGQIELPVRPGIFWELFHNPEYGFIGSDGTPRLRPVLIFDQFEEIFTFGENRRADTLSFRDSLASIVENRPPEALRERIERDDELADRYIFQARPCKVLLSLREDYLHQLERWRRFMPSLMDNRFELRLLSGPKALLAVCEPATQRSDKPPIVSRETAEAIVRFVADVAPEIPLPEIDAVPPLLSLICAEMNAHRLATGQEQINSDQLSGRSEDILEAFYNGCFREAPAGLRELVEDRLVSAEGHRESLGFDTAIRELKEKGISTESADSGLRQLVSQYLLVVEERRGVQRIELIHDVLTGVVRRSRDQRRERESEDLRRRAEEREKSARRRLQIARMWVIIMAILLACTISASIWALKETHTVARVADHDKKMAGQYKNARDDANQAKVEADKQRDAATRLAAEFRKERDALYLSQAAQSYDALKDGQITKARQILVRRMPDSTETSLPGWDWYFLKGLCDLRETGSFRVLNGHTDTVNCVLSVPGQPNPTLISAGADKTLRLWDATTGKELRELISHRDLTGLGFTYERRKSDDAIIVSRIFGTSPAGRDGKLKRNDRIVKVALGQEPLMEASGLTSEQLDDRLKPASEGKTVRIEIEHPATNTPETIELVSEKFTAQVKHDSEVIRLAVSPDGARLASADTDGQILLWDVRTGDIAGGLYTDNDILGIAFSPNNRWLATAFQNEKQLIFCKAWDLKPPKDIPPFDTAITAFAFGPDGTVAIATKDGLIRFWDVEKNVELSRVSFGEQVSVSQLSFSPNGSLLAGSSSSQIKVFDMQRLSQPPVLMQNIGYHLQFAFHPTGRYLATAGSDGVVQVWDVSTGKAVRTLKGHAGAVCTVAFLSDNVTLATGAEDHSVRLWNLQRTPKNIYHTFDAAVPEIVGVCFSSDGRYVACSDPWDKHSTILDPVDGRILQTLPGSIWHTAFLPSQPILAVPNEKFLIQFVDVTTGKPAANFPVFRGHTAPIRCIAFSSDGTKMVSGDEAGNAFVWDVTSGNSIPLPGHNGAVKSVAFSSDGKWVATSCPAEQKIRVWDPNTARLVYEIPRKTVGLRLCFSPDSRFLLTDERNGRLDLINLKTGNDEATLVGHNGVVFDAAFSPDSRRVASVGADGKVRIWDVGTNSEIFVLDEDEHETYNAVAFSPDGLRLAAAKGSHLRVWDTALFSADHHNENWIFYYDRGHYHEVLEDWAPAIADYNKALQLKADDPMIHVDLGYVYGAHGEFEKAEMECRAVSDQCPKAIKGSAFSLLASVLLADFGMPGAKDGDLGDKARRLDEYDEVGRKCAEMVEADYDPATANTAAWICSIVPGTTTNRKTLVDLMRRATNDKPKVYAYMSTLGSILYRAGDYQEAIDALKRAMAINSYQPEDASNSATLSSKDDHDKDGTAFDWIFLAMANYELGRKPAAVKWLSQVGDELRHFKEDPIFDDPNWSWDWENVLELKTIYKEAQALIGE